MPGSATLEREIKKFLIENLKPEDAGKNKVLSKIIEISPAACIELIANHGGGSKEVYFPELITYYDRVVLRLKSKPEVEADIDKKLGDTPDLIPS